MHELNLRSVVTLGHHFQQMRFEVLPLSGDVKRAVETHAGRIPIA